MKNFKEFLGKTDLICASNVICHVPNLKDLIESIDLLLSSDGTFVFEEPYLGSMFEKVAYDQIYDEHIYIFSASSVSKIFKMFNFELVDVLPQTTHGGSMRYIIKRENKPISPKVKTILSYESENKLDSLDSCIKFKKIVRFPKKIF